MMNGTGKKGTDQNNRKPMHIAAYFLSSRNWSPEVCIFLFFTRFHLSLLQAADLNLKTLCPASQNLRITNQQRIIRFANPEFE